MIELSILDREDYKRVPRTRILKIGFGEIGVAVRMGVKNANQIQATASCLRIGTQQDFLSQFVARPLLARERIR
jgi:hypothetical protein